VSFVVCAASASLGRRHGRCGVVVVVSVASSSGVVPRWLEVGVGVFPRHRHLQGQQRAWT
jgi:hypothetical protein